METRGFARGGGTTLHEIEAEAVPVIRREGIRWSGGAGGRPLRIALDFENPSGDTSGRFTAEVECAPFGAFLRWRPLTRVEVPALRPGDRKTVRAMLSSPPLPAPSVLNRRIGLRSRVSGHWVGNVNVFIRRDAPVERHLSRAVLLQPGVENRAVFLVGDGRRDAYAFHPTSSEPGWRIDLSETGRIEPGDWVETRRAVIWLTMIPPEHAETGDISIEVVRRSTGARTVVEFELSRGAARGGCRDF